MTESRKCRHCGGVVETRIENYKYAASGLDNVTLEGLQVRHCTSCGEREAVIPKLAKLHRAIAFAIAEKPDRVLPKEIRFLRKYLGLSSVDFAEKMGIDRSTVSRYENVEDPQPMGKQTEKLLRLMVIFEKPVAAYPIENLATGEPKELRLTIAADKDGWQREQAA